MKQFFYGVTAFLCVGIGSGCLLSAATSSTLPETTKGPSQSASSHQENDQSELAGWVLETGRVAQDYVQGLDQGKYEESWSKGDSLFQHIITKEEWAQTLKEKRKPLGKAKSRTLKDHRIAYDPRGLPKGAYMVVEYNTAFENAPASTELLTLRRGTDGKWRVLTYQFN